ncbi:MAG: phosphomannomutase/phosphoglucomutase, partial [Eubacterium sp.]|nr:phosphomannomutase/phosphoglucomutase [Eubacterium sp.]
MLTITKDKLLKLKSGTDIRGVAVETEKEAVELTDEVVTAVAAAFVQWYKKKFGKDNIKIAVGHDSRISAE